MTCLFGRCRKYALSETSSEKYDQQSVNGKYIKRMDFPSALDILPLCEHLYSASTVPFQQESNKIISSKIGAEVAFILAVADDQSEFSIKVLGSQVLSEELRFSVENSCFSTVLSQKGCLISNKVKADCSAIDNCNLHLKSILCVPLFGYGNEDKISNILCLANKKSFTADDMEVVKSWVRFMAPLLFKAQAFEEERKIRKQSQSLLFVVKTLLMQIGNVSLLLKEIMNEARKLIGAERCSLFLLDKEQNELVAKVFDGDENEMSDDSPKDIRIPITEGVVGNVATSGKTLNIYDAYSHPLFYQKLDEETGFKTRSILCFPIKDENGVIGVAELCNKLNGSHFTHSDEEIAETFAAYCAICILHSFNWKKVRDDQSRTRLSNGMIVQSKVSEEEVLQLIATVSMSPALEDNFSSFMFIPRLLSATEAAQAAISMFEDLGMLHMWKINKKVLTRFVITVKQGYNEPPYHNWKHGFSVAHFAYLLLKNLKLMGNYLSHLEGLSLLIACLCHDLDHRGTTSSFQVACKSILAALYSSEGSVLERHHFAQAVAVLHMTDCNILENLSETEYTKCLDLIRTIILATDLAHHFRILKDLKQMLEVGYDYSNPKHHELLLCLLVTCCDLSDQTKDWANTKEIAKMIFREFFKQGDLERAMGVKPCEMMDRTTAHVPKLQIGFLQQVVLPLFKLLSGFFPQMKDIVDTIAEHSLQWEKVDMIYQKHFTSGMDPLDFLDDKRVDDAALTTW